MSLLSNVNTTTEAQEEKDTLGGFKIYDSGVYPATIKLAYLQKANSGALGLHLVFDIPNEGEFKQSLYVTSGDSKGNKNYFTNQKGENQFLPGWNHADALCLLTVGKAFGDMADSTEEKVIKLYSPETKQEEPTKVEMVTELLNQEIKLGVIKQKSNKNQRGDDGKYYPTAEIRETNEIDKIFRAKDNMTTAEIRAEATEGTFIEKWTKKWQGQVKDRTTTVNGQSGAPSTNSQSTSKPTQSLFS